MRIRESLVLLLLFCGTVPLFLLGSPRDDSLDNLDAIRAQRLLATHGYSADQARVTGVVRLFTGRFGCDKKHPIAVRAKVTKNNGDTMRLTVCCPATLDYKTCLVAGEPEIPFRAP